MIAALLTLMALSSPASAQKSTEIFTPIGQSPGLSGEHTVIGTIRDTDTEGRTFTLVAGDEEWRVTITEHTRIWLDKSKLRQTNTVGSFEDLAADRRVEVLYVDWKNGGQGPAEWIKVEVTEGT